jgi:[acyl-carrier-protein] S-malonyltransferase
MKTAFLFPGQGAQFVGMGKDIAANFNEAAQLFKKANDIVGYDLQNLCFEGPAEKLNTTTISQPAIFVTSAAILEVLNKTGSGKLSTEITAGLSLGEYTALYAAGILNFEDALKLVQRRGEAMQAAADATNGGMVSIIGLEPDQVQKLCDEACQGEVLAAVNFNCQGQIVVSGTKSACQRAEQLAEKYGAMKAVRLEVAGAFHTVMMEAAAESLKEALSKSKINEPGKVRTIANIDVNYYANASGIADGLIKQLTSPILWQKCMERLISEGVEIFYEIGPGRVLTGLMKRINRKAKVINLGEVQALKEILAS